MDCVDFGLILASGIGVMVIVGMIVIMLNPFVYSQELNCEVVGTRIQTTLTDPTTITTVYYKMGAHTSSIDFYGEHEFQIGATYHLEYSHNRWGSTFTLDKATIIG